MERVEVAIQIQDKKYIDRLITALVRQGYAVYYNEEDKLVCFTTGNGDITKILYEKIKDN